MRSLNLMQNLFIAMLFVYTFFGVSVRYGGPEQLKGLEARAQIIGSDEFKVLAQTSENPCGEHGIWSGEVCLCDYRFQGSDCDQCVMGYTGLNCNRCDSDVGFEPIQQKTLTCLPAGPRTTTVASKSLALLDDVGPSSTEVN